MEILPVLKIGKLIVLYTPDAARTESMVLIAELGLHGAVTITVSYTHLTLPTSDLV